MMTHFIDISETARELGLIRDLSGWRVNLVKLDGTKERWYIDPNLWYFMLLATAGRTSYTPTQDKLVDLSLLIPGEVLVYPDTVEPATLAQAEMIHQTRPVISESQLARWIWADDLLEDMGLKRFDPTTERYIAGGKATSVMTSHSTPMPGATVQIAPVRKVKRARRATRPSPSPSGFRIPRH